MKKSRRIFVHEYGSSQVLKWEDYDLPSPSDYEVQINHHAVGLNFIDIYYRTGLYPLNLPSGLGSEAAGVIEAIGAKVEGLNVGDRVVYATGPLGAYAYDRNINYQLVVKIPDKLSMVNAAAIFLKGLTAQYLVRQTFPISQENTILVYAAAGGVGQLVCQWASYLGAKVIGIVGSQDKVKPAEEAGCMNVIVGYDHISKKIHKITNNEGVDVVYDSVGKKTFMDSLDSLRPLGMMVSFGNSSGAVGPISINILAQKGSLFLTRPSLFAYAAKRERLLKMSDELFEMLENNHLKTPYINSIPIASVAEAHNLLEDRKTIGPTVLVCDAGINL